MHYRVIILFLFCSTILYHCINSQNLFALAGSGTLGYSVDSKNGTIIGTGIALADPKGIALDPNNNSTLYVVDGHKIIRLIVTTGAASIIAGRDQAGFAGEGGLATNALFNSPTGIFVSRTGDIYIADTNNHRIRKIFATTKRIVTIAGTNEGLGYNGDDIPAFAAQLNYPSAVVVDSIGQVYIADTRNNRIRKIGTNGYISTAAGNGEATNAGDSELATASKINNPTALYITPQNDLYIAATTSLRKITDSTGIITTASSSPLSAVCWRGLLNFEVLDGMVYFTEQGQPNCNLNMRLSVINLTTHVRRFLIDNLLGSVGDGNIISRAGLDTPKGVIVTPTLRAYISESKKIRMIDEDLKIWTVLGGATYGSPLNGFTTSAKSASLGISQRVCQSPDSGILYFTDRSNHRIRRVNLDGSISTIAGMGIAGLLNEEGNALQTYLNEPLGVYCAPNEEIIFADSKNNRIRKLFVSNNTITTIKLNSVLNEPQDVHIDSRGNYYITDARNHRVIRIHPQTGAETVVAGTGSPGTEIVGNTIALNFPSSVSVDEINQRLLIADTFNNRIVSVSLNSSKISILAGNSTEPGYGGDGQLAVNALLKLPQDITTDKFGQAYIADSENNRIRRIDLNGIITTIAGGGSEIFDGIVATNALVIAPKGLYIDAKQQLYFDAGSRIYKLTVCSGNGYLNRDNQCICNQGWGNSICNIPLCNGILATDPTVCNNRGNCVGPETCQCNRNIVGTYCEVIQCYQFFSNQTEKVCSGHGNCISPDMCQCQSGWTGRECSTPICSPLCHATRGVCALPNVCRCTAPHYFGNDCANTTCHGIQNHLVTSVCSGKGTCIDYNSCQCRWGYVGEQCQFVTCNGIASNMTTQVCQGNGECVGVNDCQCNFGHLGSRCEINLAAILSGVILFVSFLCCGLLVFLFVMMFVGIGVYYYSKQSSKQRDYDEEDLSTPMMEYHLTDTHKKRNAIQIDSSMFEIKFEELKLLHEIAQGGSGAIIYKCKWHDTIVAIKLFKMTSFTAQETLEDFKREVALLLSLRHENIILCYGATMQKHPVHRIGIVIEYCKYGSLALYLQQQSRLTWQSKLQILLGTAKAMQYLHSKQIIHRDLKLDNVLVDQFVNVKVTDFGLSKTKYAATSNMTKHIGSSYYIAPEVTRGEFYDEKCDVFSFAMIMCEVLLHRVNPFLTSNQVSSQQLFNIEYRIAIDHQFRPIIPEEFTKQVQYENFIFMMQQCWHPNPEVRPSFDTLVSFLSQTLENVNR